MQTRILKWWNQDQTTRECARPSRDLPAHLPAVQVLSSTRLENRLLLSATPLDPALGGLDSVDSANVELAPTATPESVESSETLVFVDSAVPEIDSILSHLQVHHPSAEVFLLQPDRDGVDQITEVLQHRSHIETIHVISHGRADGVQLGDVRLGSDNLAMYAGQLVSWRDALSGDADILFYGCDLAATGSGKEFLESLAELTDADVAASDDDSGHGSMQADWHLEYQVGAIENSILLDESFQESWGHILSGNSDPTGQPLILGNAIEDQVLTADIGTIVDPDGTTTSTFQYQWFSDGSLVSGATNATYTLGDDDVGQAISVQVSFLDDLGSTETLVSDSTSEVANVNDDPVGGPVINGLAIEHQTLSFSISSLQDDDGLPASANIRWLRDGAPVAGATGMNYQLTSNDVGAQISVRLIYVDGQGTIERVISDPTTPIQNVNDPPTLEDRKRNVVFGRKLFVGSRFFERASDDPDGDPLMAMLVTPPNVGNLDLNADGSFVYTPDEEFTGVVRFEWAASDGTLTSDPATVELVIAPPIEPPSDLPSDTPSDEPSGDDSSSGGSNEDGGGASNNQGTDPGGSNETIESSSGRARESLLPEQAATISASVSRASVEPNRFDSVSRTIERTASGNLMTASEPRIAIEDVVSAMDRFAVDPSPTEIVNLAITENKTQLWDRLDANDDKLASMLGDERLVAGSFGVATSGVTLVGLTWAIRSGVMLLGFYQQKPLWSRMDPLMLMQGLNTTEDESLADVMEEQRRRLDATQSAESAGTESC
ncbi:MAG: DUF4347 domain-containing protein [Planctomycetota bacterium]